MDDRQLNNFLNHVSIPLDEEGEVIEGQCWIWNAKIFHGYGMCTIKGKSYYSHRLMYEHCYGEIPAGFHVHHTCRNKSCVNPRHLDTGSAKEHKQLHKKTHCKYGHEYTEENTYYYKSNEQNYRVCKACMKAYQTPYARRRREERQQETTDKISAAAERLIEEGNVPLNLLSSLDIRDGIC